MLNRTSKHNKLIPGDVRAGAAGSIGTLYGVDGGSSVGTPADDACCAGKSSFVC